MRHLFLLLSIVAVMLFLGTNLLFSNLRQGVFPEQQLVQQRAESAPSPTITSTTLNRTPWSDPEVVALKSENESLKARISVLEQKHPRVKGELAAILGMKEADVEMILDRSELIPNAKVLCDTIQYSGAQSTWKALQTEAALYESFAKFKAEHPIGQDRTTWHHLVWVPFLERSVTAVCGQLYQLNLPSSVVESFRQKLQEGI